MAKLPLNDGEQLFGEAEASHIKKLLFFPQPNPGRLYVTNQRVVFEPTRGQIGSNFEYPLGSIESFSVGAASTITLHVKDGKDHKLTGMFNKKLIGALTEAGVQKR